MAIAYPLTLPAAPTFNRLTIKPWTLVGKAVSPFTMASQRYVWPGQCWMLSAGLPPLKGIDADAWVTTLLSLNGQQGSFYAGDFSRRLTTGSQVGVLEVGAGAAMLSTVLPLQQGSGGSGSLAVGDWIQVGTNLHKTLKLNSGSVDVWPRLRSSYAQGTQVIYTNALGKFCLSSNDMPWSIDTAKTYGLSFDAIEDL